MDLRVVFEDPDELRLRRTAGPEAEDVAQDIWLWLLRQGTPALIVSMPWLRRLPGISSFGTGEGALAEGSRRAPARRGARASDGRAAAGARGERAPRPCRRRRPGNRAEAPGADPERAQPRGGLADARDPPRQPRLLPPATDHLRTARVARRRPTGERRTSWPPGFAG